MMNDQGVSLAAIDQYMREVREIAPLTSESVEQGTQKSYSPSTLGASSTSSFTDTSNASASLIAG